MIERISTLGMSREEWLEARRRGIGGSDVSAILGLNPYRSSLSIYMDKTGVIPVDAESMSEQAYWGTVLEEPIARRFAEKHPELTVRRNNHILINSDYPFALANIDREIRDGDETYGLEIKTVGLRSAKFWEDEDVPLAYVLQVSHYMMVTGWKKFYIAALVGGQKYIERTILRDENIIATLAKREQEFWTMVQTLTPPEADGSVNYAEMLKALYPEAVRGKTINLPSDMSGTLDGYLSLDELVKDAKENLDEVTRKRDMFKQELIKVIGDAERAVLGNTEITYKNVSRPEHMVKATTFRQFRLKQLKEEQ